MEISPRAFVAGAFVPNDQPEQGLERDLVNRLWGELAPAHGFRQMEIAPDSSYARFFADTPENGLTIQPGLIQVSRVSLADAPLEPGSLADSTQGMLADTAEMLGAESYLDVAVRQVYESTVGDDEGAARSLMVDDVLSLATEDLEQLSGGDPSSWAGLRFAIARPDGHWTLTIEPLLADDMRSLYIDLDAQYPGESPLDSFATRVDQTRAHMEGAVATYLGRFGAGDGGTTAPSGSAATDRGTQSSTGSSTKG